MVNETKAKKFCTKVAEDEGENEYARSYAVEGCKMEGEGLEVQLKYIWNNLEKEENISELRDILGIEEHTGYRDGYCQLCGDRNQENAYRSNNKASGLVCCGCYERYGDPDKCHECGRVTYEGDFVREEGNFYCDNHL